MFRKWMPFVLVVIGAVLAGCQSIALFQSFGGSGVEERVFTLADDPSTEDIGGIEAITADGQRVVIGIRLTYSLDQEHAEALALRWGESYELDLILPSLRAVTRDVVATLDAEPLYSDDGTALGAAVLTELGRLLANEGITASAVTIIELTFSSEFTMVMEARATAAARVVEAQATADSLRAAAETERANAIGTATAAALTTPTPSP